MSELIVGSLFWLCIAGFAFREMGREGWTVAARIKAFVCYGIWLLGILALVVFVAILLGGS